jgi:sulfur-oxidizing protein SoxZ
LTQQQEKTMNPLTKIRIRNNDGQTEVLVLIEHPMDAGAGSDEARDAAGSPDYVESMIFALNDTEVAELGSGPGMSTNPLAAIRLPEAEPGDTVTVRWTDSRGRSGSAAAQVK